MANVNYGWSGLKRGISTGGSNSSNFISDLNDKINNIIFVGRVTNIILDDSNPLFSQLGEWNSIGFINYEIINSSTSNFNSNISSNIAKPIDTNIKKYPLINEFVYIILAPNASFGENINDPININAYYINSISLWNHPHHNAFPNNPSALPPSQRKDYEQTEAGSVRRVTDNSTEIFLGKTFIERANIHPLLPFEGDIIYEGRWGNSIRLGSTVKNSSNNWSSIGQNGNPITIIRNGQGQQTDMGWIPTTENINNDNSSIYLTENQRIPLEASSTSYISYNYKKDTPAVPNQYTQAQIILNSGRLVFNTYEDHILLTSAKSINLNSLTSVNVDAPNFVVQANKIYLGKNEADEPLMLGTQTVNLLTDLIKTLQTFMTIASSATTNICVQGQASTLPTLNLAASDVLDVLENLKNKLESQNLVSKRNFTI